MRAMLVIIVSLFFFSCKNNKQNENEQQSPAAGTDTLPYYDLSAEILREIGYIKEPSKFLIYKITEQQGKKDSVAIDTTQFIQLAAPFYELQLNKPEIKKQYRESVFSDTDTKSYVYDYKTSNPDLPVKSLTVMTDNHRQDFKRADLVRTYRRNDTLFEERLAWTAGKKFQVIQMATAGNTELTYQTYVYWRERK
jgi:hypothetical protein